MAQKKKHRGFEIACEIARRFPGVEVETSYGTPALKVKGKFMARLRTEAEGWLAIRCEFLERDMLLRVAPKVFHLTDHYRNYPAILIDLDEIRRDVLEGIIENAWRMAASPKAIRVFDEGKHSGEATQSDAGKKSKASTGCGGPRSRRRTPRRA
jgi:hypothetical protein